MRSLSAWDGVLITIGSILGTGIFITTADMARALPHAGLLVLAWVAGGLVTLTGALTYAELGGLYPRAGGQYQFLKETYGPLSGFLFGWTAFFVIDGGGIATIAVGFGEYLGAFLPFFSTQHVLFSVPLGFKELSVNGGQLAGVLAIVFLTAVNYVGLREGAGLQNIVTLAKIGSLVMLGVLGLFVPAHADPQYFGPFSGSVGPLSAFGVAMIGVLWTYDGWYATTNMAGEMRHPERDLPRALVIGTLIVTVLYTVINVVYMRALPVETMSSSGRIGEAAANVLFGPTGARLLTAAVLVSSFGCISATILFAARIYQPMAEDGSFFPALARIHPRYRTPSTSLLWQGVWASLLTLSGSYEQLYTYVTFAVVLFHALTGAAVLILRRTRPDAPRPYRVPGYPWLPLLFVGASLLMVGNTLLEKPVESLIGLGIVVCGLPAYLFWRRRAASAQG